mgnify:CR=1 FL=1
MKANCHRCYLAGGSSTDIQDCCDWANCRTHCIVHHYDFGSHYRQSWGDKAPSTHEYESKPSPGSVEEEAETPFTINDWPTGGSLDLEGELW